VTVPGLVILALVVTGAGGLLWWLLVTTEGVYLGRRVVIWLYDRYARRYDRIKEFMPDYERWLLARPILGEIAQHQSPLVLDVATGTGRLPLALCEYEDFHGRVIGIDLSRAMLAQAAHKLQPHCARVDLLWWPAESLPFADNAFDVVTCLESLEFMPDPKAALAELIRVLRPGGLLLITNRIGRHMMPGKTWTEEQLFALLETLGIDLAQSEPWQVDYRKVWAMKAGDSPVVGARPLDEVLRCPRCTTSLMRRTEDGWMCEGCEGRAAVSAEGIIELVPLYS
jgi:ubiquinone/menaquinone biosynthesis C-methylase UbiE